MRQSATLRQFRKQTLQLQASQYRLSLQEDIRGLTQPFTARPPEQVTPGQWLEIGSSALAALLPARWNRLLNIGLVAWRVGRQVASRR